MSERNHDCGSCSAECSSRKPDPSEFLEALNPASSVKKVIGIVSGKGGVGKSLVTSMLAVSMNRKGRRTAILDADITGPSIPRMYGIHGPAEASDMGIEPRVTKNGIKLMSMNLLLPAEDTPVIWRGPIIANIVKQFWTDVIWGDLDYLLVDMPPGTGDVPLTVFQSLPVNEIVVVTSPQDLVQMIVKKALSMAEQMKIPVKGVVENYSYLQCPDCGKKLYPFGQSHLDEIAEKENLKVLGRIPMDPAYAEAADAGEFDKVRNPWIEAEF